MGGLHSKTEPSSINIKIVSPFEGEKLSTDEKPRNVSRFMLTEPRKYSSCNTENKPRNISSNFSNFYTVCTVGIARNFGWLFFLAIPRTFTRTISSYT